MAGRSPQSRTRSGPRHQAARRALILQTRPGAPCFRCERPMLAEGGVWGRGLDADHAASLAALNPRALPDVLSHAKCNRAHGGALSWRLRGITNPAERARIAEQVTAEIRARLRGEWSGSGRTMGRRAKNGAQRGQFVPVNSPQPRRISKW